MAAVNHWLHLIAAVIWIGGLAFVVMALNPSLKEKFPKESIESLAQAIRKRYHRITGVLLALILITGGFNVHFAQEHLVTEGFSRMWLLTLGLKLTLATGLFSLYLLNLLYQHEPYTPDQTEIRWARPSFILGTLIILTAAILRHAH